MTVVSGRGSRSAAMLLALVAPGAALMSATQEARAQYQRRNLVSDGFVPADHTDANLVNPWGLAANPTGVWWTSDNHSGRSTLYDGAGVANSLIVGVPGADGMQTSGSPTGIVFSGSTNFVVSDGTNSAPSRFIFAGEDGTISGWAPAVPPPAPSTAAHIAVNRSASGAIYKGLALASSASGERLYATDFHNGRIDVYDGTFAPVSTPGGFSDPNIPAGYAPFNIQTLGGSLYVTYALQDAAGEDDVPGAGNGFVDVFDTDGNLLRRLISGDELNSPWGLVQAPADFGPLSNLLLVGNFGDGRINAFDPVTGAFMGAISDASGQAIEIEGLWGIAFGNGMAAGPTNSLYFTAGPDDEAHGLFGSVTIPAPGASVITAIGMMWAGARRRRT